MRTQMFKISILTLCTAITVLEASAIEEDIVEKVARPKTTGALQREKAHTLPQYAQDRTDLVLALNNAIGPDFEVALREIFGASLPTDGLTQKQMTEILHKVEERKKAKTGALLVRASLGPLASSLTIQNNFLIQNIHGQATPPNGAAFLSVLQRHSNQTYPGGIPNPPLLDSNKENVRNKKLVTGNKRFSFGEVFPLEIED